MISFFQERGEQAFRGRQVFQWLWEKSADDFQLSYGLIVDPAYSSFEAWAIPSNLAKYAWSDFDSDAEKARIPELDVDDAPDDLDFDLSGFDEVDEAETKLDLAAAYVDMGDPDGARGILQEVLSEGTEEQKQRAQTLLDSLN